MFTDESLAIATTFKVVAEGEIHWSTDNFFTAAAVMFAAYFVFNIHYNEKAAASLEFVQR